MDREVLFRVWNKISKEYTYFGTPILSLDKKELCQLTFLRPSDDDTKVMIGGYGELEQYTGLRDSKRTEDYPEGQRVFEGDVVKIKKSHWPAFSQGNAYARVIWSNYRYMWDEFLVPSHPNGGIWSVLSRYRPKEIEVVGNIHQNPELTGDKT